MEFREMTESNYLEPHSLNVLQMRVMPERNPSLDFVVSRQSPSFQMNLQYYLIQGGGGYS